MNLLKKICLCTAFFLVMNSDLLSCQKIFCHHQIGSPSFGLLNQRRDLNIAKRFYTLFHNNQTSYSSLIHQEDVLKKYVSLFQEKQQLLKKIKEDFEKINVTGLKPVNKPGYLTQNLDVIEKGNTVPLQANLKTKKMYQADFINEIMTKAAHPDKINKNELISILHLYQALLHRPRNSITKVLTGLTHQSQGMVYEEVANHVNAMGSTVDAYRKMYGALSKSLGKEVVQFFSEISKLLISKKAPMLRSLIENKDDRIYLIVEGAEPLYWVESYEVEAIMNLYKAIPHRPRNAITKVLNSSTNQSGPVYDEVMEHIVKQGSNLKEYINIYLRLSKALNGKGLKIVYDIIDKTSKKNEEREIPLTCTPLPAPALLPTSIPNQFTPPPLQKPFFASVKQDTILSKPFYKTSIDSPQINDEKNRTEKEEERFNRLYSLLPEHHSNSITRILLGKTQPKMEVPVWQDLMKAIDQIKREAENEDDQTIIDLKYFRKLTHLQPSKNKGFLDFSGNVHYSDDLKYSISNKEIERLNRIYTLLPQYNSNSITRILMGTTQPKIKIPVWRDLIKAIDQIKRDVEDESDQTVIDLKYFRKLQWASLRVTGQYGRRDK